MGPGGEGSGGGNPGGHGGGWGPPASGGQWQPPSGPTPAPGSGYAPTPAPGHAGYGEPASTPGPQGHPGQGPHPQQPYPQQPYPQQPYPQQPYPQQPYPQQPQPYLQQPVSQQPYSQQPYPQPPYGQAPGAPGWSAPPPNAGAAPAAGVGSRAQFDGRGSKLFVAYLLYGLLPFLGFMVITTGLLATGFVLDSASGGTVAGRLLRVGSSLLFYTGVLAVPAPFIYKFLDFYYGSLTLDGQQCEFKGQAGLVIRWIALHGMLIGLSCGIYAPWAVVKLKKLAVQHTNVGGQPGRLSFDGDPVALFGTCVVGSILMWATFGIYGPWFANSLFSFIWNGTKLDGRPFQFRRDIGGFVFPYVFAAVISMVTLGFYLPWGGCRLLQWEAEHIS